jgi:hypothetical protein
MSFITLWNSSLSDSAKSFVPNLSEGQKSRELAEERMGQRYFGKNNSIDKIWECVISFDFNDIFTN